MLGPTLKQKLDQITVTVPQQLQDGVPTNRERNASFCDYNNRRMKLFTLFFTPAQIGGHKKSSN